MKALVPFNNIENFEGYKEAGAGEFYIGFWDEKWREKFGEYADLNRLTGYGSKANSNTFEQVLEIIQKVKKENLSIYVTFNSSIYTQEQLEYMEGYMTPLFESGVDGIIVSCAELVEIAKKYQLNPVISTIAGVYNSDIARFYQELGASRIILPRDLSIDDIEQIVKKVPEAEYEIFLMRNGCTFSDSNCLGLHRSEKSAICAALSDAETTYHDFLGDFRKQHDTELTHMYLHSMFHSYACGLCSIYRFVQIGIAAGKIVGRTDDYESICEDIQLLCENVAIAKRCNSEAEYLAQMKFPDSRMSRCKMGMNCYYPETRF